MKEIIKCYFYLGLKLAFYAFLLMVKDMITFDVSFMENVPIFFFNFFIALLYALIIIFENKFQNLD